MCICVSGYSTKMEDKVPFLSYHVVSCYDVKSQQLVKKKKKKSKTKKQTKHFRQLTVSIFTNCQLS